MLRRVALLAPLLLAVACASDADTAADTAGAVAAPAAPASSGDDLADVASFELTMARMDRFYAAQRALALRVKDMSPEEREAFDAAGDAGDSIDDMVRRFEGSPAMTAALDEAGMSAREFALTTMAALQSAMASTVLRMRSEADQDSLMREMKVNPANVRFMRENEAVLKQKQDSLQAELQRLGVRDDEDGDDDADVDG